MAKTGHLQFSFIISSRAKYVHFAFYMTNMLTYLQGCSLESSGYAIANTLKMFL